MENKIDNEIIYTQNKIALKNLVGQKKIIVGNGHIKVRLIVNLALIDLMSVIVYLDHISRERTYESCLRLIAKYNA